jgi:protocatechuate 3,4-dioxygenase beta subunit
MIALLIERQVDFGRAAQTFPKRHPRINRMVGYAPLKVSHGNLAVEENFKMKDGKLSRRDFFYLCLGGGLLAASYPLARVISQSRDGKIKQAYVPTPSNTLGPFYKRGAPRREKLIEQNEAGIPLLVNGRVINTTGQTLADATIEVFHADHYGEYDLEGFRHRGEIPVRASGEYEFETIMPGQYSGRAQHIHYVITAPGHRQLVTQLYFETDPKFEGNPDKNYTKDGLVGYRELIRPVKKVARNNISYSSVVFDICLEKA